MKIIIFEGIAASGKTSVIEEVTKILQEQKIAFSVIPEAETLLPLLGNTEKEKSIEFIKKILAKSIGEMKDLIIFDRLYFTHIFRTNGTINDFIEIENLIRDKAELIFLKIGEAKIGERIAYARQHRNQEWNRYVEKKGSAEETNNYYLGQQRFLQKLAEKSSLDRKIYDTSNLDFGGIAEDIVASVL